MMTHHLYVHIPFCRARCSYCDFVSEPLDNHLSTGRVHRYVDALRKELAGRAKGAGKFSTIYVGGGTPTALPAELLLDLVADLVERAEKPQYELTIEANPGTVDAWLLRQLHDLGVNRLSLGVQSFHARLRRVLGRRVTQGELEDALAAIHQVGWSDWGIDLVFGIPGETWQEATEDIDTAVAAGPAHISLYDLTYTPTYLSWLADTSGSRGAETGRAFAERYYSQAVKRLEEAGYCRYEISNFARPGYECHHNLAYWKGHDYLGVGAGAVSTVGNVRTTNPPTVERYLAGEPPLREILDWRTRTYEKAMLGLRTREGVEEEEVSAVIDPAACERLLRLGCIERRCGKLRITEAFLDVSNSVIVALLLQPES